MSLVYLLSGLLAHPRLYSLSFINLSTVVRLSRNLYRDILLAQDHSGPGPAKSIKPTAPEHLPPTITEFLAESIGISVEDMCDLWGIIKQDVWEVPDEQECTQLLEECFQQHGWKRELAFHTLYPPYFKCVNNYCPEYQKRFDLKKVKFKQVALYTTQGAQRGWYVQLSCRGCNTHYHPGYQVHDGMRTYYEEAPRYIQVGDHQLIEDKVVQWWISSMQLGWMSGGNCKTAYEHAYITPEQVQDEKEGGWRFGLSLRTEHVWDAFIISSLHRQHRQRGVQMQAPHTGEQNVRFTALMQERNEEVIQHGQDELPHFCDKCLRVWQDDEGNWRKTHVIVSDGLSMGHPCCGVFRCTIALDKMTDRFCRQHKHHNTLCAIVGCEKTVQVGSKACPDPKHQEMEKARNEKSKAAFILKARLDRHRIMHPTDNATMPESTSTAGHMGATNNTLIPLDDLDEGEIWFEEHDGNISHHANPNAGTIGVVDDSEIPCDSQKSDTGNRKVKAMFGRRRTHNEQTCVRPCGVITGRATFFGAEAVSNVLHMVETLFSLDRASKPDFFVYDTACDAKQQVMASKNPWWDDVNMCVDVWHFLNKHKTTHEFCQKYCNPAMFPELMDDEKKKWWFNTSVAEQINVWLGGYHSICREMHPVKYNFFLDEMIHLRNEMTVAKLAEAGHNPRHCLQQTRQA